MLAVDLARNALTQRDAVLGSGLRIIVVAHPLCYFTQNAAKTIQHDPVLSKLFKRTSYWLAPQNPRLDIKAFQDWNQQHLAQAMVSAYRESEWPLLDSWATPTFYFVKDGKLQAKVTGWPKAGNRAALLATIRKTGLVH